MLRGHGDCAAEAVRKAAARGLDAAPLSSPWGTSAQLESGLAAEYRLRRAEFVRSAGHRAEMSKAEAKRALDALDEIILEELGNAQKVRVGGLVQLTVRVKPAQKKRKGRNPATGEEIDIAAKPAGVDVRARPLAKAKATLPSVHQ
jgi:DNA-binding protein HU-beta